MAMNPSLLRSSKCLPWKRRQKLLPFKRSAHREANETVVKVVRCSVSDLLIFVGSGLPDARKILVSRCTASDRFSEARGILAEYCLKEHVGVFHSHGGYPQSSSIYRWIFHEINHPAIGVPSFEETTIK